MTTTGPHDPDILRILVVNAQNSLNSSTSFLIAARGGGQDPKLAKKSLPGVEKCVRQNNRTKFEISATYSRKILTWVGSDFLSSGSGGMVYL